MREISRRNFFKSAIALGAAASAPSLLGACAGQTGAAGPSSSTSSSSATQGAPIKIGIIPLTDCSSVVMAHELGLYKKHGVNVEVSREASWANVRDKLLNGELQAAHCLFGMPFSVYTGIGGPAGRELPIAMVLNNNGQAITLSKDFCGAVGHKDVRGVASAVDAMRPRKEVTFAMTFPGGTHDMWLRYWLAASGVDQKTVKIITVPPPQMVANMKVGNMDGYCVGEPWPGVAVQEGIGFTHLATQDIWKHHPEKALVLNKEFSDSRRNDVKGVMRAVLEASMWLDNMENRKKAAPIVGTEAYVGAPPPVIEARLMGDYNLGCALGDTTYKEDTMLFYNGGNVTFPRKAHGIWFMTQYMRFGYLNQAPDYETIASKLILTDLYKEVASEMSVPVPDDDMASFTVDLDHFAFDPRNPAASLSKQLLPA